MAVAMVEDKQEFARTRSVEWCHFPMNLSDPYRDLGTDCLISIGTAACTSSVTHLTYNKSSLAIGGGGREEVIK